jgi:hypothetical protein
MSPIYQFLKIRVGGGVGAGGCTVPARAAVSGRTGSKAEVRKWRIYSAADHSHRRSAGGQTGPALCSHSADPQVCKSLSIFFAVYHTYCMVVL